VNDRVFQASQAARLDSPERRIWLPADEVLEALSLTPAMVVADVGAGTGYFTLPIAKQLAQAGKVYSVDLQPEMLAILRDRVADAQLSNVTLVEGEADRTTLPDGCCDLLLLANVWHELDDRQAVLKAGRVAILDWRPDVSQPPGPPLHHRISADEVVELLAASGWSDITNSHIGAYSYLVIATTRGATTPQA
jgi:ubiquinone/menaquinone biosynthesis C-methylase UbiE